MKNIFKKFLIRKRIFYPVIYLYSMMKMIIRPSLFYRELQYRFKGAPDKIPLPPTRLVFLVIRQVFVSEYYNSGKKVMVKILSQLKKNDIDINSFAAILDFGCGCGRLLRHLRFLEKTKLFGSDINAESIKWCRDNLNFAEFEANNLEPPLKYKGESFDFIYARSVFTHLDEKLQKDWISELHRVLKPGGILYFSTFGKQYFDELTDEQIKKYEADKLVVKNLEIQNQKFHVSFQSRKFVENNLLNGYELVDFIPGEEKVKFLKRQDGYILRRL